MSPHTFANLIPSVKLYIAKDCGLSPFDLFALSHTCQDWRKCATDDVLFAAWFDVFPDTVKDRLACIRPGITKRIAVFLAMNLRCMGCKSDAVTDLLSGTLLLRLCPRCIASDPLYLSVAVDTRFHYCLTTQHVHDLPRIKIGELESCSLNDLKNRAIEVHPGVTDETSLNKFLVQRGLEDRYVLQLQLSMIASRDSARKPTKSKASRTPIPTTENEEHDRDVAIHEATLAAIREFTPSRFLSGFQPYEPKNSLALREAHISLGLLQYDMETHTMTHFELGICSICEGLAAIDYNQHPQGSIELEKSDRHRYQQLRILAPMEGPWHVHVHHIVPLLRPPPCPASCIRYHSHSRLSGLHRLQERNRNLGTAMPCESCYHRALAERYMGRDVVHRLVEEIIFEEGMGMLDQEWNLDDE